MYLFDILYICVMEVMNEFVGWFLEVDRMSIGIGYRRIKKKWVMLNFLIVFLIFIVFEWLMVNLDFFKSVFKLL